MNCSSPDASEHSIVFRKLKEAMNWQKTKTLMMSHMNWKFESVLHSSSVLVKKDPNNSDENLVRC